MIFFKSDGVIPLAHAIWHIHVVFGALIHYNAVRKYLITPENQLWQSHPWKYETNPTGSLKWITCVPSHLYHLMWNNWVWKCSRLETAIAAMRLKSSLFVELSRFYTFVQSKVYPNCCVCPHWNRNFTPWDIVFYFVDYVDFGYLAAEHGVTYHLPSFLDVEKRLRPGF